MKNSITLVSNNTPAVASHAWPTQRQIREIADDLDFYAEYWGELCGVVALLRKIDATRIPEKDFENAKRTIERYGKRDYKERIKELQGKWDELNPRHWYAEDDDEQLNVAAVSGLLANFMGSFPTSNIPNPKVFTRQLLDDVMELEPSFPALESACRKLRKSQKFMPSISEVVEAIEVEQEEWGNRSSALYCLADEPVAIELLANAVKEREAARIEAERREAEWREAEQKRRDEISAARAAPICNGDRVRYTANSCNKNKKATVFGIYPRDDDVKIYSLIFDDKDRFEAFSDEFERLAACEDSKPPRYDFGVGDAVYYGPCGHGSVVEVQGWIVAVKFEDETAVLPAVWLSRESLAVRVKAACEERKANTDTSGEAAQ